MRLTSPPCAPFTSARLPFRLPSLAAMLAVLLLSACDEGQSTGSGPASQVTREQAGDRSYFLQHHYVNEARGLGDQAFNLIRSGNGPAASDHFARSTNVLASGVEQHKVYAASRAETQRVIAGVGMLAVGIAAVNASTDARSNARTTADITRINQSFDAFLRSFSTTTNFIDEQIRQGEINSTDQSARFVDRDVWRSVVVSNDGIARSIVRIHNQTQNSNCTGFFVSPYMIATSAHCYRNGDALAAYRQNASNGRAFMTRGEEYIEISHMFAAEGYDDAVICHPSDIALLLTVKPSSDYLPVTKADIRPGQRLMALGYSGDLNNGYFLRVDYGCRVTSIGPAGEVRHDCSSYRGNSGGPILTASGTIAAVGVHSCGPRNVTSRADGRAAIRVQRLQPMIRDIRTRPTAQGRLAGLPY